VIGLLKYQDGSMSGLLLDEEVLDVCSGDFVSGRNVDRLFCSVRVPGVEVVPLFMQGAEVLTDCFLGTFAELLRELTVLGEWNPFIVT
jgi:hypothetical protein